MNNLILRLCEAIKKSDLADKEQYLIEISCYVGHITEYFETVMNQQLYFNTRPADKFVGNRLKFYEKTRSACHDRCIDACNRLNEFCSMVGIEKICDFDTDDRRKVAEFAGYIANTLYFSNTNCSGEITEWLEKCPFEKGLPNGNKTVSDNVVLDTANNMMDRFDEAFKELAK